MSYILMLKRNRVRDPFTSTERMTTTTRITFLSQTLVNKVGDRFTIDQI